MNPDDDLAAEAGPEARNPTGATSGDNGMRLRAARQARGFSQQQLATMAGVSRQAVSAVESGQSDPSLRVALALSQALGLTVEEMFGPVTSEPRVDARPLARLDKGGTRVSLAQVGESFVAAPLSGAAAIRSGFVPTDGVADEWGATIGAPTRAIRPLSPPQPTLVVAGCDPALPLLEVPLSLLDPPVSLLWWQCASHEALELAANGLVHAAGSHLRDQSGDYNVGQARQQFRQGAEVVRFCSWREGLALKPGVAGGARGVADVARAGLRFVNRQPGSEARLLLDRELARLGLAPGQLRWYETSATGHIQVVSAIAAGLADAGIASEPAALAFGLVFVPLATERFDIVVPHVHTGTREVQGLLRVLRSRWLRDQLASLPGYDPSGCGEAIATIPPLHGRQPGRPARERKRRQPSRR
ncbi:MAG TPA: substrate-binding domain-containing protein [Acidimicrobiales bacterium]|nr:substrate-binding domain-containing protein [Acidimicrobiales bacterium]